MIDHKYSDELPVFKDGEWRRAERYGHKRHARLMQSHHRKRKAHEQRLTKRRQEKAGRRAARKGRK